jgi:cell division protein FtsB
MKVAADSHQAPAWRRWVMRFALAMVVAVAIGYVPPGLLHRDARAIRLAAQLRDLRAEARTLEDGNVALVRDVLALRNDVHAIEALARDDFAIVYPDEVVLQIKRDRTEPAQ